MRSGPAPDLMTLVVVAVVSLTREVALTDSYSNLAVQVAINFVISRSKSSQAESSLMPT